MNNCIKKDIEKQQRRHNAIKFTKYIYPSEIMMDSLANFIWKESVFQMRELQKRHDLSGLQGVVDVGLGRV